MSRRPDIKAQKMTVMKKDENGGTDYSFPYMRQPNTNSNFQNLRLTLWNSSEGTVLGRNGKGWAQIILFYIIFYSALGSLFAVCMKGLLSTISETEPKWQLDNSIIGTNPGLGFRPLSDKTEEGSLIWYDAKNQSQIHRWVNLINEFLELYLVNEKLASKGRNQMVCDFETPAKPGHVCEVDVRAWHPCTPNASYSYDNASPCFFLKLNKIYGWMPEFYDDPDNLPEEMPEELVKYIKDLPPVKRKQVWISCAGESAVDRELLEEGGVQYVPEHGLPAYYFPYTNTPGYLSPLVAVRLRRPPMNRIINIECRAWAKNINYIGGQRDRQGSVHFELMID